MSRIAFKVVTAYYQISFDVKKGFTEVHRMQFLYNLKVFNYGTMFQMFTGRKFQGPHEGLN